MTNMLLLITQVMCIWCSHPISYSASGLKALEDHVKSTKHVRNARLVMEAQAMIASGTAGNASRQLCGVFVAMQKKLHVCTCSVWCYICRCVWVSPPPPPPPPNHFFCIRTRSRHIKSSKEHYLLKQKQSTNFWGNTLYQATK